MGKAPGFDIAAAHRYFSVHCFNNAWDLLEKTDRSPEDERLMIALNQASIYHWLQRPDCDNRRLSVGHWQASRIHALLGNATEALRRAEECLSFSGELEPFYLGYAHEAMARAARVAGNAALASEHKIRAKELAGQVKKVEDRDLLLSDLTSI